MECNIPWELNLAWACLLTLSTSTNWVTRIHTRTHTKESGRDDEREDLITLRLELTTRIHILTDCHAHSNNTNSHHIHSYLLPQHCAMKNYEYELKHGHECQHYMHSNSNLHAEALYPQESSPEHTRSIKVSVITYLQELHCFIITVVTGQEMVHQVQ
jgi:hypothetical protein